MLSKFKSTKAFLIALLVLLAVPSLLLSGFSAFRHYKHELAIVERTALQVAEAVGKQQNRIVQDSETMLRQLIKHPDFNLLDVARCNEHAKELRVTLPEHTNIALANLEGDVLCSVIPLKVPVNIKDRPYFKRAVQTGKFEGGEYQIGRVSGRAATNYGLAVYDPQDMAFTPLGVALIGIDILKLNQVLIDSLLMNDSILILLASDGSVIARYPDPDGFTGRRAPDSELVKAVFSQQKSRTFQAKGLDGVQRIYAVSPVRGTGDGRWSMVVGVPVNKATSQLRELIRDQMIFMALVFGGLLMIGIVATAQFSRRLRTVTHVAEKIRNGDFAARCNLPPANDEIGSLTLTFNEMAAELARRDSEQKQSLLTIETMNAELESRVTERTHELNEAATRLERLNGELFGNLQEREQQSTQLKKLAQMSDLLQACRKLEEAYDLIARYCETMCGSAGGAIYIMRSSRNRAERAAIWGEGGELVEECLPDDCWAMRRGSMHRTGKAYPQPVCAHAGYAEIEETVCLPILAQGEMVGFIYVYLDRTAAHDELLSRSTEDLLVAIAEQGGQTIAALRLREELQRQSIRDPLTGLFNRRYMEETLIREQNRAKRHGTCLAVISFDIDHFKSINDTYGHDAGDIALKQVANILRSNVRVEDVVCRMGGEEILVVLPGADVDQAAEKAEALRCMVKSQSITYDGKQLPKITISGGVAGYSKDADNWEAILKIADQLLYQAKRSGRDQILAKSDMASHRAVRLSDMEN